ncbi:MAG: hypothetical protein WCC17_08400 [Candidatus Nitrosopolaris sp.]
MAWLLGMSREEKAQYVIQLYKENKSIREIAKLMHMSFRDIGAITKRLKSEAERENGYATDEEVDTEPKSKQSQAFKLFSEGNDPVDAVIALDLPADQVRSIYQQFWELNNMYKLAEAYDQIKDYLPYFLRLHKILNDRGMEEQEIINVLELANDHQLKHLQWKVEYLRNDIEMLEAQKTKSTNYLLNLNRRLDEFQGTLSRYESSLPQAYMNQGLIRYDNTNNLYPIPYSEPGSSSYSIRLNYTPMTDEWLWQ